MKTSMKNNERGSLLIACIIVAFLILAVLVQFSNWVTQSTRANVHRLGTQKAMVSADSGVQAALQFLRTPQASGVPIAPLSMALPTVAGGTTFYTQLSRRASDPSLVDINSTGYFQIANGSFVKNGNAVQQAAVHAVVQMHTVGDYFAASPGQLEVGYGSNISSGIIYGKDIVFDAGLGNPKTIVKAASYFNSISPANYNNYVTFTTPSQPQKLGTEPVLPTLDLGMRNDYTNMAGASVLAAGTVLSGTIGPPGSGNPVAPGNVYNVYMSPGDITLGVGGVGGSSCTVNGSFLIYSQGDIHIANGLVPQFATTSWPALMAEGNIYIDDTAPDNLTINATMITNGQIKALGASRPNGNLTINGGMVAGGGMSLGSVYTLNRSYKYQAADPTLPLPFSSNVILYNVTSGKYGQ